MEDALWTEDRKEMESIKCNLPNIHYENQTSFQLFPSTATFLTSNPGGFGVFRKSSLGLLGNCFKKYFFIL